MDTHARLCTDGLRYKLKSRLDPRGERQTRGPACNIAHTVSQQNGNSQVLLPVQPRSQAPSAPSVRPRYREVSLALAVTKIPALAQHLLSGVEG